MHPITVSANGQLPPESIYEAIGDEGFERLVAAFYAQVPTDSILGPMYANLDLEAAEKRLRDFLIFRFGGPTTYIEERGHPRLRMRHMPFHIDQEARDRWLELMENAFKEANLPAEPERVLRQFFEQVSTFMINSQSDPNPGGRCPVDHSDPGQGSSHAQPQQQPAAPSDPEAERRRQQQRQDGQ